MRPVTKVRILGLRLGFVLLALYWMAIFTGTHMPTVPQMLSGMSDKVKHFGAFFGLATLLCYVTNGDRLGLRFGGILLVCALYGALDELTQSFVPGRSTDLYDWAADVSGTSSAIALYIAGRFFLDRYRGQESDLVG